MHIGDYQAMQAAYSFYNRELFAGRLPENRVTFTLTVHRGAYGYFAPERYAHRSGETAVHEIALNPAHNWRSDAEVLSTLVHEMTHLEQQLFGKPSRGGYHNKEWAAMMRAVGLMPSDTGAAGGKPTGQRVSHYVVENGEFDSATKDLLAQGWGFDLARRQQVTLPRGKNKSKYVCRECHQKAWAKPDANLMCGDCEERMECAD